MVNEIIEKPAKDKKISAFPQRKKIDFSSEIKFQLITLKNKIKSEK